MSSTTKVVSVIGGAGAQGISVVKSLLDTYKVRAFTRSPAKLQHISHPNLIIVQVDTNNQAALTEALRGSWAVFANTFSDYDQPLGVEEKLGKSIVDAVASVGVEWLVFSSLPEGMPFRAFQEKSSVMRYAREIGKRTGLKNIFVEVGYYMSNFQWYKPVQNPKTGVVEFTWSVIDANTYFPIISTQTDLGPIVKAILANPDKWNDAEIPIVGEALTLPEIAAIYGKVYNVPTRAVFIDQSQAPPMPAWWSDMHRDYKEPGYFPAYAHGKERKINQTAKKLYPGLKTWEQWLGENGLEYVRA